MGDIKYSLVEFDLHTLTFVYVKFIEETVRVMKPL